MLWHNQVIYMVKIGLKGDVLPEMLSTLECSLPKANGYYHPLAISFPSYWIPWSNIGIRSPTENEH